MVTPRRQVAEEVARRETSSLYLNVPKLCLQNPAASPSHTSQPRSVKDHEGERRDRAAHAARPAW